MTIQEVFNLPAIVAIERKILAIYSKSQRSTGTLSDAYVQQTLHDLFEIRKTLLDKMFEYSEENVKLLSEFHKCTDSPKPLTVATAISELRS